MTFLPIVDRELRVAARRKSTYRMRTWTVVVALVVGCFSLFPVMLMRGPGGVLTSHTSPHSPRRATEPLTSRAWAESV